MTRFTIITFFLSILYCAEMRGQSECLDNFLERDTPLLESGRDSMLVFITKVKNKKPRKQTHLLTVWYDSLSRTEILQYQETKYAIWYQFRRIRRFDKHQKIIEESVYSAPYRKHKKEILNFNFYKNEYNSEGLLVLSMEIEGTRDLTLPDKLDTINQNFRYFEYSGNKQIKTIEKSTDYRHEEPYISEDTLETINAYDSSGHQISTVIQRRKTILEKVIFQYNDKNCILRIDSSWQYFAGGIAKFLETDRFHFYYAHDTLLGMDQIHYSYRHWDQQKSTTFNQIKYTKGRLQNRIEERYPHHVRKSGFHPYMGGQTKNYQFYNDHLVKISSGRLKIETAKFEGDVPKKFIVYSDNTYNEEVLWIDFE